MKAKTNFLFHSKTLSKPPALLLVLVLGGTLLWAGDKAWKAKPYQQWKEKEIEAILTDSPWVRVTPIQRSWVSGPERDVAPPERSSGGVKGQTPTGSPASAPVGAGAD